MNLTEIVNKHSASYLNNKKKLKDNCILLVKYNRSWILSDMYRLQILGTITRGLNITLI